MFWLNSSEVKIYTVKYSLYIVVPMCQSLALTLSVLKHFIQPRYGNDIEMLLRQRANNVYVGEILTEVNYQRKGEA